MKASIIGIGHVGSAAAHSLTIAGVVDDLLLVSRNLSRASADALDLTHAGAMLPRATRVQAGTLRDAAGSNIVILTLSAPNDVSDRQGRTAENAAIFRELVPTLAAGSPDAVFIVVTNPVDALTWLTIRESHLDPSRVIGCGTVIDSARLRSALSQELKIHADDVRAYVLGEHGHSQFVAASLALTGGVAVREVTEIRRLAVEAMRTPFDVFERKGYTNYAIAQAVTLIAASIARDERRTFPVSTLIDGYLGIRNVCMSLPCVVGRHGIVTQLYPELDAEEQQSCLASAASILQTIERL